MRSYGRAAELLVVFGFAAFLLWMEVHWGLLAWPLMLSLFSFGNTREQ